MFDPGVEFYTWRSEIQEGAKWTWAGFGLSAPFRFTLHPYWGSPFLWLNLLDWSPCHHFLLSMSCTITDTPTHHTDLERRRGSVEVKSHCSFVDTQPSTIKMNKMGLTVSHWMVDLI